MGDCDKVSVCANRGPSPSPNPSPLRSRLSWTTYSGRSFVLVAEEIDDVDEDSLKESKEESSLDAPLPLSVEDDRLTRPSEGLTIRFVLEMVLFNRCEKDRFSVIV